MHSAAVSIDPDDEPDGGGKCSDVANNDHEDNEDGIGRVAEEPNVVHELEALEFAGCLRLLVNLARLGSRYASWGRGGLAVGRRRGLVRVGKGGVVIGFDGAVNYTPKIRGFPNRNRFPH